MPLTATFQRESLEIKIELFLCAVSVLMLGAYVSLAGLSALHAVARNRAVSDAEDARKAISSLELEYMSLSHGLTKDDAVAMGLSPISEMKFVNRNVRLGDAHEAGGQI